MLLLQFVPIVLASLLLAAHFLRSGNVAALAVCLALIVLLAVRRPWAAAVLRLSLAAGALEWARTALVLIQARRGMGEPFLRLAAILCGVAAATALCLFVFRSPRVRRHFRLAQTGS